MQRVDWRAPLNLPNWRAGDHADCKGSISSIAFTQDLLGYIIHDDHSCLMDPQSVGPSGTELSKKPFPLSSPNGSFAAHSKRGTSASNLECRQPILSCSFNFGAPSRRNKQADQGLSKSSSQLGFSSADGASDGQSWLVTS